MARSAVLAFIVVFVFAAGCAQPTGVKIAQQPNVILILTDDLDARLLEEHPASYPNLSKLAAEGTTFENAFVTDSLCCPSRATILRGQYPHNHQILTNEPPSGGFEKFRAMGHENSTIATWLQSVGYRTVLIGKYLNGYEGTYVPPGWDEWYGIAGDYRSTRLNENGTINHYDPGRYHLDDVLAQKAAGYVSRVAGDDPPFFMWLGTTAPHAPATPAPRHEGAFADVSLPRPPSFDEKDVSDKPDWISDNPPLTPRWRASMEDLYRKRLQSMLAVDEMVGHLTNTLGERGELEDTYIFFTSDNGYHMGQHRLTTGKWTAYEEDIRVPLIVRGPGVPEGRKLEHLVLNNDLAPTFAELGGGEVPSFVDGRSLVSLLTNNPPAVEDWREAFLVEAATELVGGTEADSAVDDGSPELPLSGDPAPERRGGHPALEALRTKDALYVEYEDGERELYNLEEDPYQLDNAYAGSDPDLAEYERWLDALGGCAGATCRTVEDGH